MRMWVSKKKFKELEKRVADLEKKQNRQVAVDGKKIAKAVNQELANIHSLPRA